MSAQLAGTVFVTDPDTHQSVTLDPGTCPEPRLAALVTNPAAWVDGKLPRLPKAKTEQQEKEPEGEQSPPGGGPDDASGDDSATASDAADPQPDKPAAPAAKKTAAKKTATAPSTGRRTAAAEGTSGQ